MSDESVSEIRCRPGPTAASSQLLHRLWSQKNSWRLVRMSVSRSLNRWRTNYQQLPSFWLPSTDVQSQAESPSRRKTRRSDGRCVQVELPIFSAERPRKSQSRASRAMMMHVHHPKLVQLSVMVSGTQHTMLSHEGTPRRIK